MGDELTVNEVDNQLRDKIYTSTIHKIDNFLKEMKDLEDQNNVVEKDSIAEESKNDDENCKAVVSKYEPQNWSGNIFPLLVGSGENERFIPIELREGNIVEQRDVDAIVNAANDCLQHAAGVAVAIDNAAGSKIHDAYLAFSSRDTWNTKLSVGDAVITPAFDLEKNGIKKIIHAVGPCEGDKSRLQKLHDAYENSMKRAKENDLRSIVFPSISTCIFGCPIEQCTPVAIKSVFSFLRNNPDSFDKVIFIIYPDDEKIEDYRNAYQNNLKNLMFKYNRSSITYGNNKILVNKILKIKPIKSLFSHHE